MDRTFFGLGTEENLALSAAVACGYARNREAAGDYEGAQALLNAWWKYGQEPHIEGLDRHTVAELWLRAGTLTGLLGSTEKKSSDNKKAQSWISKGLALFESLGNQSGIAECWIELGNCYYRDGSLDLSSECFQKALICLPSQEPKELYITALMRRAIVARRSSQLSESKATFEEIAKILRPQHSLFLQGRFFNEYAAVLKGLGQSEDDPLLLQEASSYFHQASKCFEQAGNLRHCAAVLNNLGVLLVILGQDNEAEKNFDEARRLFVELKDAVCVAQTDESRAQLFLKIADFEAATEAIVQAVRVLRESGEEALLAESLTTQGIIYARLSRWVEARYSFNEALHTAERCADLEGAGRAALSLVEEMRDHLTYDELREFFARAEYLLAATQSNEVRERLRAGARLLAAAEEAERKRREQAIQDKKMAALGQLASGVAHNFNNALTIIKGRVQILQRMELPGLANKSLDLINETVDDSASMIRRIRDFGRPRTAEDFIRLDIAQIISSAVEMARPRCAGQAIDVLWRTEAPIWVSGDPGELKEVFVNLLYNAVDAIGEAGVIAVSSEIKGQTLELSFSDTGPGMTDEVRSHLFEPFFTTKGEKGTGLGLATCYSIVNAHSGIIEAESALGEGTTFKITMPLYKKPEINLEEPLLVGEHRHQLAALTV